MLRFLFRYLAGCFGAMQVVSGNEEHAFVSGNEEGFFASTPEG